MKMMTNVHLCHKEPITNEEIKQVLKGRKVKTGGYVCASCSKSFPTICILHYHCTKHSEGGSFYFDHVTKTAYPKHDTTCSYTQVDKDLLGVDFNEETLLAYDVQFLNTTAREINQDPCYKRTKTSISVSGNGENAQKVSKVNSLPIKRGNRNYSTENLESENTENLSDEIENESTESIEDKFEHESDEEPIVDYIMKKMEKTNKRTDSSQKEDSMTCKSATLKKTRVRGKQNSVNKEAVETRVKRPNKRSRKEDKGSMISNTVSNSKKALDKMTSTSRESFRDTSVCVSSTVGKDKIAEKSIYDRYPRNWQTGRFLKRKHLDEFKQKLPYVRPPKQHDEENQVKKENSGNVVSRKSCRKRKVFSRFSDAEWETAKEKSLNSRSRYSEKVVVQAKDEREETKVCRVLSKKNPKDKSLNSQSIHSEKVLVMAKDERGDTRGYRVQSKKEEEVIKYMYHRQVSENVKGHAKQGKIRNGKSNKGQHRQKQQSLKYTDLRNFIVADEVYAIQENVADTQSSKNQPEQEEVEIKIEAPSIYIERDNLPTDISMRETGEIVAPVEAPTASIERDNLPTDISKKKIDEIAAPVEATVINIEKDNLQINISKREIGETAAPVEARESAAPEEPPVISIERNDLPTDISEKKIGETAAPVEEKVEVKIENESDECTEVTTDTSTCATLPPDFSASRVLLSLSDLAKEHLKTVSLESKHVENDKNSDKKLETATKTKNTEKTATKTKNTERKENHALHASDNDPKRSNVLSKNNQRIRKDRSTLHKCETCGKVGNMAMIKYHKELHSSTNYICEVCGKEYRTRISLNAHSRLHEEKKFKCHHCPRTFHRRQYWRNHLLIHAGEFPYVCSTCNKGFRESYILKRHIRHNHDNVRNFECDICGQKFFTAKILAVHKHRHFNPTINCHYCPKLFKTESDRLRHELTHSGEKQYFCPKCSTGFSQLQGYYRHMRNKHDIGRVEARKIKIRNDDAFSREKIHMKETGYVVDNVVDTGYVVDNVVDTGYTVDNVVNSKEKSDEQNTVPSNVIEEERSVSKKNKKQIDSIPHNKVNEGVESLIAYIQDGKLFLRPNDRVVPQCDEEVVVQSDEGMVIQSAGQMGNELFDHLYVADPSNVTIQVLTEDQPLEEGTVSMETTEENQGTGDVSVGQQNIVVLSEYPEIEGIEGYTPEYTCSTLDI